MWKQSQAKLPLGWGLISDFKGIQERIVRVRGLAGLVLLGSLALLAVAKEKEPAGDVVDSGSFGVFVNGKRMATEIFTIRQQKGGNSTTSSQFKEEGSNNPSQRCEMQITPGGALVRYEWHELLPGKSELEITPNNEFLIERVTEVPGEKPKEKPFLMPNTSVILDNNFFVHREILVWKYMASSCPTDGGQMKCGPAQFGAIIPQERDSVRIAINPVAQEKVPLNGSERQLLHLSMKVEDADWDLWLDPQDHFKLMKVARAGENMEVVRDQ
jgi:predicted RecA/RadA family phage recombinase